MIKQKDNNVLILTVTFPDESGLGTSKYHTRCLAVVKSSNDHQPVIDHHLKKVEQLLRGITVFCSAKGKIVIFRWVFWPMWQIRLRDTQY